jgi:hypothetical protein
MYSHKQTGWMTMAALAGAIAVIGAAATKMPAGSPGMPFVYAAMAVMALMVPLFGWLTVTVDEEHVTARFGIGLIRKRIKIRDIKDAEAMRNKWWYGWGMRVGPNGWIYCVSGLDAVAVELKGGGTFTIGTNEPEELTLAIKNKIK